MPKVTALFASTRQMHGGSGGLVNMPASENNWLYGFRMIVRTLFDRDMLLLDGLAFLLARVVLMGEVAPFGLALFLAVAYRERAKALPVGLWAILGALTTGNATHAVLYAVTMLVFYWQAPHESKNQKKMWALPLLLFFTVAGVNSAMIFFEKQVLYSYILAFVEASFTLALMALFRYALPVMMDEPRTNITLSAEQTVSFAILLAIAVGGLGDFVVAAYSVKNIVVKALIMLFALAGGAGLGSAMGVSMGMVATLSAGASSLMGVYAFSGLLAGMFRHWNKIGVGLGFLLATVTVSLFFEQAEQVMLALAETGIAFVLFSFVPQKAVRQLRGVFEQVGGVRQSDSDVRRQISKKLQNFSHVFADLAVAFNQISNGTTEKIKEQKQTQYISVVTERVCRQCSCHKMCWEQDFERTYNGMLDVLELAESGATEGQLLGDPWLKRNCSRKHDVVELVNLIMERGQAHAYWQKRVVENRRLLSEHLKGLANIMHDFSGEITKTQNSNHTVGRAIKERAAAMGCELYDVKVVGRPGFDRSVNIKKPLCACGAECTAAATITPLVAEAMHDRVILDAECGHKNSKRVCQLSLTTARPYKVETGVAAVAKAEDGISGDTYSILQLEGGRVAIVLSDGMGSGLRAAHESATTVRLLEQLLTSGFDLEVAVRTVNSMLLLRAPEETFATVDLLVIDLYTGVAEFLKIGSSPSFVKRVHEVSVIRSASLPIGIISQIEIDTQQYQLCPGDIVVMVSDGVIDSQRRGRKKEDWVAQALRRMGEAHPTEIAERLLASAKENSAYEVSDDMTVLAVQFDKCQELS